MTAVQMLAVPVLYVLAHVRQVAALLIGGGVLTLMTTQTDMPVAAGLRLLAVALVGALSVGLAVTLPHLATSSSPPTS